MMAASLVTWYTDICNLVNNLFDSRNAVFGCTYDNAGVTYGASHESQRCNKLDDLTLELLRIPELFPLRVCCPYKCADELVTVPDNPGYTKQGGIVDKPQQVVDLRQQSMTKRLISDLF